MFFNSPEFLMFVCVVYPLYLILSHRFQNIMLLLASYFFYGWWDVRFLFLVALSTTVDYWVGLTLDRGRLTKAQQIIPAAFLYISGFIFLCIDVGAVLKNIWRRELFTAPIRQDIVFPVFVAISVFLLLLFLVYKLVKGREDGRYRFYVLLVSLTTQLGLLGVFKYFNFFSENLHPLLASLGIFPRQTFDIDIALPVGISFYTFQSLSYTIDIYRRQFKPTDRFLDFALFVAYFPQLQAGPIERGRQLIPQLARPRKIVTGQCLDGIYLILQGFFKKTAIADGVAPVVDQIYGSTGHISWIDIVVGTLLFSVQIYCDFSGYIDIARGISKLMGIELVQNFDHPYFSTNAREFWRRWNMSLSSWLRDYLYIPLGGSRESVVLICRNLMITMVIGGLWHGAAWNFVLWGFYQGALLCINRVWVERRGPVQSAVGVRAVLNRVGANIIFFTFVCYGWLLFRAHSLSQITDFTKRLFTEFGDLDYVVGAPRLSALSGIAILVVLELAQASSRDEYIYRRLSAPLRGLFLAVVTLTVIMGMSNEPAQFIYFKF